jgi:hypothetical protein
MNNTEKKLNALIEALGFDVEENHVFNEESYRHAAWCLNGAVKVNKENYIHPEFHFTKRDEAVICKINPRDTMQDTMQEIKGRASKPPIGLKPKTVHDGDREVEIINAMIRYLKAKKPIPDSWSTELWALQSARP